MVTTSLMKILNFFEIFEILKFYENFEIMNIKKKKNLLSNSQALRQRFRYRWPK